MKEVKTQSKTLPPVLDLKVIESLIETFLNSLPEPLKYKVLQLLEKEIKERRQRVKSNLERKLIESGIKTDKGYLLQDNNYLIELKIQKVNNFDTTRFKRENPELASKYIKQIERKILEVTEINR